MSERDIDPPDAWTDDRLDAAFAEHASGNRAPAGLTDVVLVGVRRAAVATPALPAWRRWLPAAGVVGALLLGAVAIRSLPQPGVGQAPSDGPTSLSTHPTVTASAARTWRFGRITVTDTTGLVRSAREATDEERATVGIDTVRDGGLQSEPLTPTSVVVGWTSSTCDRSERVRITGADPLVLGISRPPSTVACAGGPLLASMVLEFGGPPPDIALEDGSPAVPEEVLGLPVIDVPAAIAVRDSGADDREMAVRGWYPPTFSEPCALAPQPIFLEPMCLNRPWLVLTASPEDLVRESGIVDKNMPPSGPSIRISLDGIDEAWAPALDGPPVEVVLLGHFDDDRSPLCPDDVEAACRDRFVVDQVARVDGVARGRSDLAGPDAKSTIDEVLATISIASPDRPVLATSLVPSGDVLASEPSLRPDIDELFQWSHDAYWIVRVLDGDRVVRYVLGDGGDPNGPTRIGEPRPIPPTVATAGPEAVPTIGRTTGGLGGWMVTFSSGRTVEVVDWTDGPLVDVRVATAEESNRLPLDGPTVSGAVPLGPTSTMVGWNGSLCEPAVTLDVEWRGQATLSGLSESLCRLALVRTRLVLTWAEPSDETLRLRDQRGRASFPTTVAGLPVMHVPSMREIRARPGDDREIAVAGWWENPPIYDCMVEEVETVLVRGCVGDFDEPQLLDASGTQVAPLMVPTGIDTPTMGSDPTPVVVVGHFDDRRATTCPAGREGECENLFIVDAIWMDGRLGTGAWERHTQEPGRPAQATRDLVDRTVRELMPGPDAQVLSVGLIDGPDLTILEPATLESTLANEPWVWHLTVLVDDRVRTVLISDADLLRRQEVGGDWAWHEVVGATITTTMAVRN